MADSVPKTITRDIDIYSEILSVDHDFYKSQVVYEFSNGRQFLDTDDTNSGIYEQS